MRRVTDVVSEGFIWGVGITRPRAGHEHRAAQYITAILGLAVFGAVGMFFLLKDHLVTAAR